MLLQYSNGRLRKPKTQHGGFEKSKTISVLVNADLSFSGDFQRKKYLKNLKDCYSSS